MCADGCPSESGNYFPSLQFCQKECIPDANCHSACAALPPDTSAGGQMVCTNKCDRCVDKCNKDFSRMRSPSERAANTKCVQKCVAPVLPEYIDDDDAMDSSEPADPRKERPEVSTGATDTPPHAEDCDKTCQCHDKCGPPVPPSYGPKVAERRESCLANCLA